MNRFRTTISFVAKSLAVLAIALSGSPSSAEWPEDELPRLIELYKEFHQAPELSHKEEKTAARLADALEKAGAKVTRGVGGHGVVAIVENGEGPVVMLRADLDALPVAEQTGLEYASKVTVRGEDGTQVGVMHACGHDVHMTNLVGVTEYLAKNKDKWSGTLMCIGQPAEERGEGAKKMLADGLFKRFPKPDYAVALHVDAAMAAGKVGYRPGFALANVDSVDIEVRGRGGHGAYPHKTVDPIVQAATLILDLQTIASRETDPLAPVVITVGSIHGGTKHNIIADNCHLQITVRTYEDSVRTHVLAAIRRKANAVAASYQAPEPVITVSEGTPALENDAELTQRLSKVFERVLGEENVVLSAPSMGGEDFSQYGRAGVPILMYRLGSLEQQRLDSFVKRGLSPPSLHSPLYYPDIEPTLRTGLKTMAAAAIELAPPKK